MMTTLITVLTLILVAIIALWAAWPTMRSWIEQPKYDVLKQIRRYEDSPQRSGSDTVDGEGH